MFQQRETISINTNMYIMVWDQLKYMFIGSHNFTQTKTASCDIQHKYMIRRLPQFAPLSYQHLNSNKKDLQNAMNRNNFKSGSIVECFQNSKVWEHFSTDETFEACDWWRGEEKLTVMMSCPHYICISCIDPKYGMQSVHVNHN